MKLTLEEVKQVVLTMFGNTNIADSTFASVVDSITNLTMKCAKMVINESNFSHSIDDHFNGDDLPIGGFIEEYFQSMVAPIAYDPTGANTLAPHYPESSPVFFSYPLEALNFPITVRKVEYKQYFTDAESASRYIATLLKKHSDAQRIYRYAKKKALLGFFAKKAIDAWDNAITFATATAYGVGTYLTDGSLIGVVVKAIPASPAVATLSAAVTAGMVAVLALVEDVSAPIDTATGEAFIKQVKSDVEKTERPSSANNLMGAIIQPERSNLLLVLKEGVMPSLEVDTYAGAFHRDDLDTGLRQIVVDDWGGWSDSNGNDLDDDVLGILLDERGAKLHLGEVTADEQLNAEGHFYTIFTYSRYVPYISPYTFIKIYRKI